MTDVNKFTLVCDLNFQKINEERKRGRGESEEGRKERKEAGRQEGSFSHSHQSHTLLWGWWRCPGKHFRKSFLPTCYPKAELRKWTVLTFWCVFLIPSSLFSHFFILRVDFIFMLKFINPLLWNILGSCITKD